MFFGFSGGLGFTAWHRAARLMGISPPRPRQARATGDAFRVRRVFQTSLFAGFRVQRARFLSESSAAAGRIGGSSLCHSLV